MTCTLPLCAEYALGLGVWAVVVGLLAGGGVLLLQAYRASRKALRDE
jgi:O-antigen/teichoic acid export membrane protein